jgi:hypothetical protein
MRRGGLAPATALGVRFAVAAAALAAMLALRGVAPPARRRWGALLVRDVRVVTGLRKEHHRADHDQHRDERQDCEHELRGGHHEKLRLLQLRTPMGERPEPLVGECTSAGAPSAIRLPVSTAG